MTAAAIIAWRDANGPFASVDQLGEVDGIGPARLDKLRDLVRCVTTAPGSRHASGPAAGARRADQLGGDRGGHPVGSVPRQCVALAVAVAATGGVGGGAWRHAEPTPGAGRGVVAVAVVGVAFAVAVGTAGGRRPSTIRSRARFGTTAAVVVTPTESPRVLRRRADDVPRHADVARRAAHRRVASSCSRSGVDYGELTAGRPAAFRARIVAADAARPVRGGADRDRRAEAGRRRALVQRAAADVRARFADAARAVLPADQAAMLPALVLGDTSAVDAARRSPSSGPPG